MDKLQVIRGAIPEIKTCYQSELETGDKSAQGKLVVQFEVGVDGVVRDTRIKQSALKNSHVETCVQSIIKSKKFPLPPEGGVFVIDYPFEFGHD